MISQLDLFKFFRMISRCVINCDECALRFYVCSIFGDRVFVLFIFHHGVHWTYKCFAYVAPRGWIWVRRGLCGFGDIRGSVGRYDPWGIKAAGFAITTKINHYAAVTCGWLVGRLMVRCSLLMLVGRLRDGRVTTFCFVCGYGRRRAWRIMAWPSRWTPFPFRPVHAWLV